MHAQFLNACRLKSFAGELEREVVGEGGSISCGPWYTSSPSSRFSRSSATVVSTQVANGSFDNHVSTGVEIAELPASLNWVATELSRSVFERVAENSE
jgi:hypothetical protein